MEEIKENTLQMSDLIASDEKDNNQILDDRLINVTGGGVFIPRRH